MSTWLTWLVIGAVVGVLLYVGNRFADLIVDSRFPVEDEELSLPDDIQ